MKLFLNLNTIFRWPSQPSSGSATLCLKKTGLASLDIINKRD